ncbi:MAG TPA: succinate dehydrogenase assembly factor 2 [Marinospirillum sp.]|uniref:FAD assembly factor SdhE n=1 Tax=Marinospirillum sp. TaxID=2183934 RepID=UPI002B46B941|nr:succinate dehydrogenase assembly factor 2 [Marinospirillum sp.]HKM14995.1 succinate dehydrogenase assembly factor 2 [Marinospirillum sp.]
MTNVTPSSCTSTPETTERNRLYWQSRRGMWELDLLLVPFLDGRFNQISEQLQNDYKRLLKEEDQDLFVWLMRREPTKDASLQAIVQEIIDNAEHGNLDQYKGL